MANNGPFIENLNDPLQGMDCEVRSVGAGGVNNEISGAFTSVMFKIVSQTETYLTLDQRIARQLSGEIIFVWAAEQGWLDPSFIANAFGTPMSSGMSAGRPSRVPRANRFNLEFKLKNPTNASNYPGVDTTSIGNADTTFNNAVITGKGTKLSLINCRTDTLSFGVTAGRHVVATSYQGTAEGLQRADLS